ncbi:MAG: MFS transporter [Gammaproteobacteria bacterium]|nr:MAG: MFS transporter [Gammaproteobacteria bacterium]
MMAASALTLLSKRRFGPFFATQACGAFNDNLFKQAILLLVTYRLAEGQALMLNIAAGLFILPFFLLSMTGGRLADKYEKSGLIRAIKMAEVAIMLFGGWALVSGSVPALMALLCLMGAQSALFGPVKYAILPQHLHVDELVAGNAWVEAGTFLAILLGTMSAGILYGMQDGLWVISVAVVVVAVLGYGFSRSIPSAPPNAPDLELSWHPFAGFRSLLDDARRQPAILNSILAISWFWFLGASYLTQFNLYTRDYLGGDPTVATLMLTLFSIGIGLGSALASVLSRGGIELALVPIGALGLTLAGGHLFWATPDQVPHALQTAGQLWVSGEAGAVWLDLALIGVFGGLYIVPLYALVQHRAEPRERARIIGLNNVLNALFMVASALFAILVLSGLELSLPQYFLVLALMNAVVAVYIFWQVPEFVARFWVWLVGHTLYRVRHEGMENVPQTGAALLVCNHVSYMDALIIGGSITRPIRFVMDWDIYRAPVLNVFFRLVKAIPICSEKRNPDVYHAAFEAIHKALSDGELVCIFPEGRLTTDGEIGVFRPGVERILARDPVPVIPVALCGLWGSFFSHKDGHALTKRPRRFWSHVLLKIGEPMPPTSAAGALRQRVAALRGDAR